VLSYFTSDVDRLTRSSAKDLGLTEGYGVFVLGFPMGVQGAWQDNTWQDYAVVREGSIARVRDTLDSPTSVKSFLIDSFVFPGNSGSAVVLKPESPLNRFSGEKPPINVAYLLGIVRSYLPYTDVAISPQTHRTRVTFEENSGLTEVIPADYIDETIRRWERPIPAPNKP